MMNKDIFYIFLACCFVFMWCRQSTWQVA